MYLEKLELQGFKSFVQKTSLEFPQPRGGEKRGLAAIVGPNGSGKSNLADAVRWVMGEQSMKLLRSKKSEDVIFSGTDRRARVGLAEVSLCLNNEDGQAPVDYREVVITRRLYRSGESEYLLNRHPVRLQDITLLLARASFGQKTYSIIGQGMVDAILAASPFERKEFFDEAAGTRHLHLKREEALRKLGQVSENLRQADVLIQEITPRLRSLVRQVKRLERRDELAAELRTMHERYYGSAFAELEAELAREEAALQAALTRRQAAEEDLGRMEAAFAAMERAAPSTERFAALTGEHQRVWQEKASLHERVVELRSALAERGPAPSADALPRSALLPHLAAVEQVVQALASLVAGDAHDVAAVRAAVRRLAADLRRLKRAVVGEAPPSEQRGPLEALLRSEQALDRQLGDLEQQMREFQASEEEKSKAFFTLQRAMQSRRQEATALLNDENGHRVVLARLNANRESLQAACREDLGVGAPPEATAPLTAEARGDLKREADQLKAQLAHIGTIDPETAEEYRTTKERHEFLTTNAEDLKRSTQDLRRVIRELDGNIARQFNEAFQKISHQFEHFFKVLFGGGHAELAKLTESAATREDEAVEDDGSDADGEPNVPPVGAAERVGIEIQATPPGKRLKSISMLSGGERALTSLALICAIIANNPAPFVVLDEVDAALDEANSARLAEIIDQLSHRTQFIIITHNRAVMHQSNILYGVTMDEDGASRVLSLKLEDAVNGEGGVPSRQTVDKSAVSS